MEKTFIPAAWEKKIYGSWLTHQQPTANSQQPKLFTILMPPPNANASLHAGHGMYTIDDLMIRYKKLQGYDVLWLPGLDHAGFETQYVYEKQLAKKGQSRLDFDRQTFYNDVFNFVKENSGLIYSQFKRLGFLGNWERSVFTLDKNVLQVVYATFAKMEKEGYVYRSDYIVNYCNHCGTSLSELETVYEERNDPLYYIRYGELTFATVRPETLFADVALAVHPQDKRYQKYIGRKIKVDNCFWLSEILVIADESVDQKFGTGVVKITPAHDQNDYIAGKKHNLPLKKTIDLNGRLTALAGEFAALKTKAAQPKIVEYLKKQGLLVKIDSQYVHNVTVCYKCKRDLEPTVIPNWFIKVEDLKKPVIEAVKKNQVTFHPAKFKKQILDWLLAMHDWPISRQIVWGIRIPVWYDSEKNPDLFVVFLNKEKKQIQGKIGKLLAEKKYSLPEIERGLQKLIAPIGCSYKVSDTKPGEMFLPETDTFDTWFSSGQWPLVTLREEEYATRFPTDFIGTLSDILPFWISRMIMFSLYIKKQVPFKHVYLWSMVADAKGIKMSKSKGNVINPIDLVEKYGADAFRGALLFGTSQGGKVNLSEDKVRAMRNYANKVWNVGRLLLLNKNPKPEIRNPKQISKERKEREKLKRLEKEFLILKKNYFQKMDKYQFSAVFDELYEFIWHRLADFYLEELKENLRLGDKETLDTLEKIYFELLKFLHPFMPFVTEAIYKSYYGEEKSLLFSGNNLV